MESSNRRRLPRVEWDGEVVLHIGKNVLRCEGMDISPSGLRIRGSWSAYRGQSVKVKMDLDGETVHAFGEVVWGSEAQREGWGIRFTTVHPGAANKIAKFVQARIADAPPGPSPVAVASEPSTQVAAGAPAAVPAAQSAVPAAPTPVPPVGSAPAMSGFETPPPAMPEGAPRAAPVQPLQSPSPGYQMSEVQATPAPRRPQGPMPCPPELHRRIEVMLASGMGSGSIVSGAKGALGASGELYLRVGNGPVVVLPPGDPIVARLRWLAAAVATWSGEDDRAANGPEHPLVIQEF